VGDNERISLVTLANVFHLPVWLVEYTHKCNSGNTINIHHLAITYNFMHIKRCNYVNFVLHLTL